MPANATHERMKIILPDKSVRTTGGDPQTVEAVLVTLSINPLDVIVSQNGKLVPEDTVVSGNDEIRIIRIAHGG
jgi:sulfur carrier protein